MTQPRIIWKTDYEVGVHAIDEQHKILFAMLDNLTRPDEQVKLADLTLALGRYIEEHFAFEEALMLAHNYPRRPEHSEQHVGLRTQYQAMTAGVNSSDPLIIARTRMIVYAWFTRHILGDRMDRDLGQFMQRKGVYLR